MSLLSLNYAASLPDAEPLKKGLLARAYGALYRARMARVEALLELSMDRTSTPRRIGRTPSQSTERSEIRAGPLVEPSGGGHDALPAVIVLEDVEGGVS